jgi:hypothetical protein
MFPLMTLTAAWEEFEITTGRRRGYGPRTLAWSIMVVATMAAVSVVSAWLFRRMLRRARLAEDGTTYHLSRDSWRGLLWVGFAAGLACGAVIMVQIA